MFKIYDGRSEFYQWDMHQQVIIDDHTIEEVHFCNKTDSCALVSKAYEKEGLWVADVPDILLQESFPIRVYAYCNKSTTRASTTFKVNARSKPADYVYTDVIDAVEQLQEEVAELAKGGEAAAEVEALKASVAALSNIVLTLDTPEIEVVVEKEEEEEEGGDTPLPPPQYYIHFNDDSTEFVEKGNATVEFDGVKTSLEYGKDYYCHECRIYGNSAYMINISGNCIVDANDSWNDGTCYEGFTDATISLNGNVHISDLQYK